MAANGETAMTQRTSPPFRAEHVGSLLRPPAVAKAREDASAGRIPQAELRAIEDKAIREAVKKQEELGLQAVTDGEMRRRTWHMDFIYGIGGLEKSDEKVAVAFKNEGGDLPFAMEGVRLTGKLGLEKTIFGDDFAYLKSVAKATPKLTIPSPSLLHRRGGRVLDERYFPDVKRVYPDADAFFRDLSAVYADEIDRLGKLGLTYLQIDDTSWASLCDPHQRELLSRAGSDGERVHRTYIRAINDSLKKRPKGMTVATHTCRGNFRSSWIASGGYDFIAEALFSSLEVDAFFLEYDDARSGGFAPLRFVPKGKMVVLGLVTSKKGALEKKDDLKRRIDEAAKNVPLDQICLSPQCGFSSTLEGNALGEDEQWAKLRLVVDTAREVWG
jgi:5-methyltetrahydropteroyltriglutamate--homocysteine methyltransferase